MIAAIFGLSGPRLTDGERELFGAVEPAGYILFRRNIVDQAQVRTLTDDLRALHGRDPLPILIDQEGGRVTRMGPPVWPEVPSAHCFAGLYQVAPISAMEAARAHGAALAAMLREVGINVNCAPVLDLRRPGASEIVGDRAFGSEPMQVAALGRALLDGMREGGVAGVIKHMPGHGRALVDSHDELPVIDADAASLADDLAPFRALAWAPIGMVAHVIYQAWDADRPATLSETLISEIIRGRIGFDGLLLSDDIQMAALSGDMGARAAGVLAAGCDIVLHCSGDLAEMRAVSAPLGEIRPEARARLERALTSIAAASNPPSYERSAAKRDALLAYA